MGYENAAGASQLNKDSLADTTGQLNSRLHEIHERLVNHGDLLLGPSPRPTEAVSGNKPPETPSVRRSVQLAHAAIDNIFSEPDRISGRM